MGFKMKKISSLMSYSPLHNTEEDLASLDYKDTSYTTDLSGKKIALEGVAIIPGKEVERQATTPEEIEAWKNASQESKDKYLDKEVIRERDYTEGLLEKYGRYYKEDQKGRKHVAHPIDSGEYLSISEAKKHFGGEDTPDYIKWFKNHPTAGWAMDKPGYAFETDYEPEFKSNKNLTDYTYKINE